MMDENVKVGMSKATNMAGVNISAFARLHMGFFDLNGGLGRKFGSVGLSLANPSLSLNAKVSEKIEVTATNNVPASTVERTARIVHDLLNQMQLEVGVKLEIKQHIPIHAGLGSGTQLALAVGKAISELYGLGLSTSQISTYTGRGSRSGIGLAAFDRGGLLIDGGRSLSTADAALPPLLARYDFPEDWRILLIVDNNCIGVHGVDEKEAFKNLPVFPAKVAADLCRHVLMQMMPAIVEGDLSAFGSAIQALQTATGDYFAPAQGGRYASQHVADALAYLEQAGVACFGQSSWGPTGFAVFERLIEAESAVEALTNTFKNSGLSYLVCSARNQGADIY